jgi:hypothetical protein
LAADNPIPMHVREVACGTRASGCREPGSALRGGAAPRPAPGLAEPPSRRLSPDLRPVALQLVAPGTARSGVDDFRRAAGARLPDLGGDATLERLVREYGAILVAEGVDVPPFGMFDDAVSAAAWQKSTPVFRARIQGIDVALQPAALGALLAARAEAKAAGLDITPRGTTGAERTFAQTVSIWETRVAAAVGHWRATGRLSASDAVAVTGQSGRPQLEAILRLERRGLWFAKGYERSILRSGAPPGASQHLSRLALDVAEFADPRVRAILAKHGWHQTVVEDLPHFTYLGLPAADLPGRGLRKITLDGVAYWIPDVPAGALLQAMAVS